MTFKEKIKAVWNYVRNSWEDEQGHLSYKRISQFIWSWLIVMVVIKGMVTDRWSFYTLLLLTVLFSITAALITIPQLIDMIKSYSKIPEIPYDDAPKESAIKPDNPDK